MACAIHGINSLCDSSCPGYIASADNPQTPTLPSEPEREREHDPGRMSIADCAQLAEEMMAAHERTRGVVAEFSQQMQEHVNALASHVNQLAARITAAGIPEAPQAKPGLPPVSAGWADATRADSGHPSAGKPDNGNTPK